MQALNKLRTFIDQYASSSLTDDEFALIAHAFTYKKLRRRQFLLQAGEIGKYYAFVAKGALRQYCIDERGTERVSQFALENWWTGDRESFTQLIPSPFNIDALEECELLLITNAQLQELMHAVPAITQMLLELDQRHFIAAQKRLHASIRLSAEERYVEFVNQHPDFIHRFPLHMIASYLGISTETLSRVRYKLLRQ